MDVSIADGDSGHQAGSWAQTTVLVRTAGRQSVKARGRDDQRSVTQDSGPGLLVSGQNQRSGFMVLSIPAENRPSRQA